MKKLILLVAVLLSGCHSLDRFTGNHRHDREEGSGAVVHDMPMPVDVHAIAGQSNGVSPMNSHAPVYSMTGRVQIIDNKTFTTWTTPTASNPMVRNIAWIYLGDMLAEKTGRIQRFVNISNGNTSTRNWMQYKSQLVEAVKRYQPADLAWIQGESDQVENIPYDEAYADMKELILATRDVCPAMQWYIALDGYIPEPGSREQAAIRRVQRRLIAEGYAKEGPDIDEMRWSHPEWFEYVSHNAAIGAEFDGDGLMEHAKAWYRIYKNQ